MKIQFIILVMAGMLLVPYGSVFASSGEGVVKPVGYVFPSASSVIVLGSDALKGTALSPDELIGYAHVPWVSLDASVLNVLPGYNLFDLFSYGCEGFSKEELSVKILIAPTYQDTVGGAFITGLFEDVSSNPVITEEGAYAYKIIVTKPGSDSPLSVIETGYIGVSKSSVGNTASPEARTAPLASSVAGGSMEAVDTPVEVALPVEESVAPIVEGGSTAVDSPAVVDVPNDVVDGSLDTGSAVVCDLDPSDSSESLDGSSLETSTFVDGVWIANTEYGKYMYETYGLKYWDDYGRFDWKEHCDVYPVQSSVSSSKILRVLELINQHRVKNGLNPLLLDQDMTRGALVRAAECNVFFNHTRPGDGLANSIPDGGAEIITVSGDTPEKSVNAWINSNLHNPWLLKSDSKYIGIGQVGNSWVCGFGSSEKDSRYKPADSTFLKSIEMSNRVDYVLVDRSVCSPKLTANSFDSYQLSKGISTGSTYQLKAEIPTIYYKKVNNSADVVPSSLVWSSSNPVVASVDKNGLVTGLQTGASLVTGTLNGQTISYNVQVRGGGVPSIPPLGDYLVKYRTHVQNIGWQDYASDGVTSGTEGLGYRLEGINVDLDSSISGGIEYRTHVQNIGWQNYVSNGKTSGTEGLGYRLEAINIRLTGEAASKYDVYYRVHAENIGWMGWARNGENAGTAKFGYRLEGIEIDLVPKGSYHKGWGNYDNVSYKEPYETTPWK